MAQDPVAVAASNNPMLTTLTAAVSGKLNPNVNLVDTLNGSEFTVFAPTDDAFAKIDPATIEKLKTDSDLLTSILTYHVVPGQASPAQVAGTHKTVQGAEVTVTGMGNSLKVNDAGRGVRWRHDRQRDRVHDRHRADAAGQARYVHRPRMRPMRRGGPAQRRAASSHALLPINDVVSQRVRTDLGYE